MRLIRSFLEYASHHTVEDIQAFTSQWVPCPTWVKAEQVAIPPEIITKAAKTLTDQLGVEGVESVGGVQWWQWRPRKGDLRVEWIEMRGDYIERKSKGEKGRRVMLYVHGGAYFFGSVDEHRYQMQRHARKLRARVFAPRYRLAPQFPFPCGLHDCLAAYLYLLTVQEPEEIILAGDSAGGGMIVSVLVTLRDQGIPLPAGAVLISPWVDLTHSFPSVAGDGQLDYIPAHGFMQRPSLSWPPPNKAEMEQITQRQSDKHRSTRDPRPKEGTQLEAVQKAPILQQSEEGLKIPNGDIQARNNAQAGEDLSIEMDGKLVILQEQMQLYATNQQLSHPLVSPIFQPSLGGLPPLLILTGGGEVLRDEQIYLAHKAANPGKYSLGPAYQAAYDPNHGIMNRYKPTDVQLQVWDDLCHVAPTLSFTRPAKFMYRSIAQFGAWSLARAQHRSIEITDDDDVSIISSVSDIESSTSSPSSSLAEMKETQPHPRDGAAGASRAATANTCRVHHVGKAGDPLPPFENHMIRQRVDRHGVIYPMAPESEVAALQMPASEVGTIKPGPVKKWLAAKKEWNMMYASEMKKVQKKRIKEMMEGGFISCGAGERPPPSALAGRRRVGTERDGLAERRDAKKKKSWGMMLWSLWGSKHDKSSIKREVMVSEEETEKEDEKELKEESTLELADGAIVNADKSINLSPKRTERPRTTSTASTTRSRPKSRRKSTTKSTNTSTSTKLSPKETPNGTRIRRRTMTVSDQGQTEGGLFLHSQESSSSSGRNHRLGLVVAADRDGD